MSEPIFKGGYAGASGVKRTRPVSPLQMLATARCIITVRGWAPSRGSFQDRGDGPVDIAEAMNRALLDLRGGGPRIFRVRDGNELRWMTALEVLPRSMLMPLGWETEPGRTQEDICALIDRAIGMIGADGMVAWPIAQSDGVARRTESAIRQEAAWAADALAAPSTRLHSLAKMLCSVATDEGVPRTVHNLRRPPFCTMDQVEAIFRGADDMLGGTTLRFPLVELAQFAAHRGDAQAPNARLIATAALIDAGPRTGILSTDVVATRAQLARIIEVARALCAPFTTSLGPSPQAQALLAVSRPAPQMPAPTPPTTGTQVAKRVSFSMADATFRVDGKPVGKLHRAKDGRRTKWDFTGVIGGRKTTLELYDNVQAARADVERRIIRAIERGTM